MHSFVDIFLLTPLDDVNNANTRISQAALTQASARQYEKKILDNFNIPLRISFLFIFFFLPPYIFSFSPFLPPSFSLLLIYLFLSLLYIILGSISRQE